MSKVFDRFIRFKTRWIALITALGFLTLPGIFYFGWPRSNGHNRTVAEILRWICLALSVLLTWMVYDRERAVQAVQSFRTQYQWKARREKKKREKLKALSPDLSPSVHQALVLQATAQTLACNLLSQLHFSGMRTVFRHNPYLCLLLLVCLLCPYPSLEELSKGLLDDKVGLLMIVRVPLVGLWLVHDESKLFRERHSLCQQERAYLSLDHMVALRSLNRSHPGTFIVTFCTSTALLFSFMLWILERDDSLNGLDEYHTCLAVTIMFIMFKWPDDCWFTHEPESSLGRVCSAASSLCGFLIIFMLLEVCYDALTLSSQEQYLFNYVGLKQAKREERTAAAKLIQFHWRYHRSIATIVERERAETLRARVMDKNQFARRISQFRNISALAAQQGNLEDDAFEAGAREPLLKSTEVLRHEAGPREREVMARYGQFWEEDAASYKLKCEMLRKELREAHRGRLELEPPRFSCKKEVGLDGVIRRALVSATQEVVRSHVEESLSKRLNNQ